MYHRINQYAKVNNKFMKDDHKNKKSSYLQYLDLNNLHSWEMSPKLPVNKPEGSKMIFNLIKIS